MTTLSEDSAKTHVVGRGARGIARGLGEHAQIFYVPVGDLRDADSPRSTGVDLTHVEVLAEGDAPLPPILVHHETMRVVDGMHRLAVARAKGQPLIGVEFFHGGVDDAFCVAVRSNVTHGLALSSKDRHAAAARIIGSHPMMSDRSIAGITGLAARTVAGIRATLLGGFGSSERIGSDGRVRPMLAVEGRLAASEIIACRPQASLREIAREAGVSVGTARDVRLRLQEGKDPVPGPRRRTSTAGEPDDEMDVGVVLEGLRRDPSVRYSQSGRALIRWLDTHVVTSGQWHQAVRGAPPHWQAAIARIARECATVWMLAAEEFGGCD